MKTGYSKWIVFSAAAILSVAQVRAQTSQNQNESQTSPGVGENQSETSGTQATTPNDVRLSKLMDAKVNSQSGESLGDIEDLLINPMTGKIDFVVLGRGGFLGIGEKRVPVPWQAVNVQSENQFTVNVDKSKLQSAPTLNKNYSELANPQYAVTIYRFYEIPMGAGETPGGVQPGEGTEQPNTPHSTDQQLHQH